MHSAATSCTLTGPRFAACFAGRFQLGSAQPAAIVGIDPREPLSPAFGALSGTLCAARFAFGHAGITGGPHLGLTDFPIAVGIEPGEPIVAARLAVGGIQPAITVDIGPGEGSGGELRHFGAGKDAVAICIRAGAIGLRCRGRGKTQGCGGQKTGDKHAVAPWFDLRGRVAAERPPVLIEGKTKTASAATLGPRCNPDASQECAGLPGNCNGLYRHLASADPCLSYRFRSGRHWCSSQPRSSSSSPGPTIRKTSA